MTTEQKNEVIARFMGWIPDDELANFFHHSNFDGREVGCSSHNMFYHKSFDNWLMPACQKFVTENSRDQINFKACHLIADSLINYLSSQGTILDIHNALFEGINWLNKQNKEVCQ